MSDIITIQEAFNKIKDNFKLKVFEEKEENKSFYTENDASIRIYFYKTEYEREEVVTKLITLFDKLRICDGFIEISHITLLYTLITLHKLKV